MNTTSQHVLVLGGMRYIQKMLRAIPGVRTSFLWTADKIIPADIQANQRVFALRPDYHEWLSCAQALHRADPIDRLICYDDRALEWAALIAQALNLPFYAPETVRGVNDKLAMREKLRAAGLDDTPFQAVRTAEDIQAFVDQYGYPAILKPRTLQGSTGITKIHGPEDIQPAIQRTMAEAHSDNLVIESFLVGDEFNGDAISENGQHLVHSITRKYKDPVTFVEIGHQSPAVLPESTIQEIRAYLPKVLTALGIHDGPTHTEFYVTAKGVRIVETHTRVGGDYHPEMDQSVTGLNVLQLAVEQSLGMPVFEAAMNQWQAHLADPTPHFAAIWYRTDPVYGIFKGASGVEDVARLPGVMDVCILKESGERIRPAQNSDDRLACVRSIGSTASEALTTAQAGARQLTLEAELIPPECFNAKAV
jgi:Biotin carboxylase